MAIIDTPTSSTKSNGDESDSDLAPDDNPKNPYQAPDSQLEAVSEKSRYRGKIYNAFSIAAATVFGSVLVSGLLIAANFDKFGEKGKAVAAASVTIIVTILLLFISLFVSNVSSMLYIFVNFVAAIVALPLVQLTQGEVIEQHEEDNREFHSIFRAIGIGIVCMFGLGIILTTAVQMFIGYNSISY